MAKSRKIYKVKIDKDAAGFIRAQAKKIQRQIFKKINSIAEDPYHRGAQIGSSPDLFKARSGRYRIAYKIKESYLLILVVRVGHRRDFYRYFER